MVTEALEEYIANMCGYLALTSPGNNDLIRHVRVVAFAILKDLSMAALSPNPTTQLWGIVACITQNIEGRPMHYDSDTALSRDAKAGQVVFRYQKQIADDLTRMIIDCTENAA